MTDWTKTGLKVQYRWKAVFCWGTGCLTACIVFTSGCMGAEYIVANRLVQGISAQNKAKQAQAQQGPKKPQLTQLQKRQLQTREYEDVERTRILSVAVQVLQDDEFVIGNANEVLGLLSASKQLHNRTVDDDAFMKGVLGNSQVVHDENSSFGANLTVTQFGDMVRVRLAATLNYSNTDGARRVEQVTEPQFYQHFFSQLEKGIFIEQEGI